MPEDNTDIDIFALHNQRATRKLRVIVAITLAVILLIFLIIVAG